MTLKTSLIITGDSKVAQQAVDDLKKSVDSLNNGSRNAANAQGAVATATNATAAAARGAAVAQGAVAAANTTVAATGRAAAVAQGAVAVATEVATGAMASFGISAMTVQAILTGGLSLALTAGIGFLTGFAGELFSAGAAADGAAPKVDRMTASVEALIAANRRLTAQQVADGDLSLRQKEGQLRRLDERIAKTTGTRARNQERRALVEQRDALDNEIFNLRPIVDGSKQRWERQVAMDAAAEADRQKGKSGASSRPSAGSAARGNEELARSTREAAAASKQLQADLDGAISRYDPARKAASDYADELARINKLAATNGKDGKPMLSADDAASFRAQASANYLGKALDLGEIKDLAKAEQDIENARGAIDKLVLSINAEAEAVGQLNPIEKEMLGYRKQLADLPEGERAAAEARIRSALEAKQATEDMAEATRDAQRAQEQLQGAAISAFADIIVGGQKASDVVQRLAQSIASAAIEATLFGTGPMAALLGGATVPADGAPKTDGGVQSAGADLVGKSVGKEIKETMNGIFGDKGSFGKTLRNAGLGYAAGGLTGSRTGGAVGGAIGGKAAEELLSGTLGKFAGPLGAIAGGLVGGLVGGLLKKAKYGTATITGGEASDVSVAGNSSSRKTTSSGLAGSVQGGIADIADQFGGTVGSFNTSIGMYKDNYRVSTTGYSGKLNFKGNTGASGKGLHDFGEDGAGAVAFAIQDAIADGAIKGLSGAIQKALLSNDDIDKALEEALKVQEVEILVGGIGGAMTQQFKDLERQAKERVRIATQYGFDVVAIEKKNAEDRTALTEQMMQAQVGSLQRLVTEMTAGSMFEGSGADQRTALLAEIEKAKGDLGAGKEGAADTLANLYSQLNAVSKEYFGATGQFAADRSMMLDEARAAIAKSNADINAASAKISDPALTQTNAALDENNDQNAQILAALASLPANIAALMASGGGTPFDLSALARNS